MDFNDVLEKLENNGYEAYIVGGYVRDYLLNIKSTDIDICTNAKVKDILDIFNDVNVYSDFYGNVKFLSSIYQIDITTYRKEISYENNKPSKIEYVDNLYEDLSRRDFTMNTLCMNREGSIIDLFNGKKDIENKLVRVVGDAKEKIEEDPTRCLRAVRFATILNFRIEDNFYDILKQNKVLLKSIPKEKVKDELTKILTSTNALKGLDLLKRLGFDKVLGINYGKVVNVEDICGMYSQLTFSNDYPFSKEEKDSILAIQNILKYGKIDNSILFNYGLYFASVAGSIMKIDKETITNLDKNLPIKSVKDIKITSQEICDILNIEPSKIISEVYQELQELILNNELINDNELITKYIELNRKKWA